MGEHGGGKNAKYPNIKSKMSDLLQKRLNKNVKYFDSGDYNMAKAAHHIRILHPDGTTASSSSSSPSHFQSGSVSQDTSMHHQSPQSATMNQSPIAAISQFEYSARAVEALSMPGKDENDVVFPSTSPAPVASLCPPTQSILPNQRRNLAGRSPTHSQQQQHHHRQQYQQAHSTESSSASKPYFDGVRDDRSIPTEFQQQANQKAQPANQKAQPVVHSSSLSRAIKCHSQMRHPHAHTTHLSYSSPANPEALSCAPNESSVASSSSQSGVVASTAAVSASTEPRRMKKSISEKFHQPDQTLLRATGNQIATSRNVPAVRRKLRIPS